MSQVLSSKNARKSEWEGMVVARRWRGILLRDNWHIYLA